MIMSQADSPAAGFRPFFNPATGEWITYTAIAEDNGGQLVRFSWRSVPGGVITEHIHPRQEERFTILAGQAHFTLNGEQRVAGAGETIVVPAGVPHSEGNPGPGEIEGIVELRPALRAKELHEAFAGLVADGKTTPGRAAQPAPARRHLLALPPRKPGHLTAHLGAEPHAPPAMGAGQGLRRAPLLRPLGQPDPIRRLRPPTTAPQLTGGGVRVRARRHSARRPSPRHLLIPNTAGPTQKARAHNRVVPRTAVFVRPGNLPHDDGLLAGLGCERNEARFPLVDGTGLTSVPGVWAAGNVADPRAQVITSAGAGSAAAIAINADLVQEDVERATADLAERPFSAVTEARVSDFVPGDRRHGADRTEGIVPIQNGYGCRVPERSPTGRDGGRPVPPRCQRPGRRV